MKNNRYIVIFFILQAITFIVTSFVSMFIGTVLQAVLVLYELFYVVNKYEGNLKKSILNYLKILILLLIIYSVYIYKFKDASTLINLINLSVTPMFIYTFYSKNNFSRFKFLVVFQDIEILLSLIYLITKNYYLIFPIIILYPFLFIEREYSLKHELQIYLPTLVLILTKSEIFTYPILGVLLFIIIYKAFNKELKKVFSLTVLFIISLIMIINFKTYLLTGFNSEVFGNEHIIVKLLKLIIPIIPYSLYSVYVFKNMLKNKFKINYEMYLLILDIVLFILLSIYTRYDYNFYVIYISSIALLLINSYNLIINKKIDPKKVTIMSLHTGFGGIERYVSSLCKMFKEKDVEVISTYKVLDKPAFDFDKANIKYLMNYGPNKERFKKALNNWNIINIIKEGIISLNILINRKAYYIDAIDEVDSKYIITTRDYHNKYAGIYADKDIIKIATEHNYHNDDEDYINRVVNSVKYSDYFVLVSEELRKFYSNKVNKKVKCLYIPNVIDSISTKKVKYGTHEIVTVGRLDKIKAQDDLIDVIKIISKEYSDVHLNIIGDGEEKHNLFEKVKKEKLKNNVSFSGFLAPKEIDKELLKASIYVTTSHSESFGLSIIEAQSYSMPVVAFDSANGVKMLLNNGNGILIKNRNKNEMAKEIIKLFEDKKEYTKLSKKSLDNAKNYLIDNVKPLWSNIIK